MTRVSQRRQRIVRLRSIEHRIATARHSKANAELTRLATISTRLAALRDTLGTEAGMTNGLILKSNSEMTMRLETAQGKLVAPIAVAETVEADADTQRKIAHRKEESSARLQSSAAAMEDHVSAIRADANRPFRKFGGLGGERS
jgi:Mg2+ and Co2+ transporter CorA